MFSDLRVALFFVYVVLVVWRISVGAPEGYWPYVLAFSILSGLTRGLERGWEQARLRRDVSYLASLDPATARQRIGQMWSAHARHTYRTLLEEEGTVEEAAGVERFPYARSARRAVDGVFVLACAVAALAFIALFAWARKGTWIPWVLWVIGGLSVAAAGWARRRAAELASTIEVSAFGLTWIAADGGRRAVRWHQSLVLQNQPRRRRLVLAPTQGGAAIPVGYRRVGFERLLRLTLERGGFETGRSQPATPPADGA